MYKYILQFSLIIFLLFSFQTNVNATYNHDLAVKTVSATPYKPIGNKTVRIMFTVKNEGTLPSTGFNYQITFNDEIVKEGRKTQTIYPNQQVSINTSKYLRKKDNPNESNAVNIGINIYPFEPETNTSNNTYIHPYARGYLDLKYEFLSYKKLVEDDEDHSIIHPGDEIEVLFKIRNSNNSNLNASNFKYYIYLNEKKHSFNTGNITLSPNQTYTFQHNFDIPDTMNTLMYLRGEVYHQQDQYHDNDTHSPFNVHVYALDTGDYVDLKIKDLTYEITKDEDNDKFLNLSFYLENIGEKPSSGFKWYLYIDDKFKKSNYQMIQTSVNYQRKVDIKNIKLTALEQNKNVILRMKIKSNEFDKEKDNNEMEISANTSLNQGNTGANNTNSTNNPNNSNNTGSNSNGNSNGNSNDPDNDNSWLNNDNEESYYETSTNDNNQNLRYGDLNDCEIAGPATIGGIEPGTKSSLSVFKKNTNYLCYPGLKNTDFTWSTSSDYRSSINTFGTLITRENRFGIITIKAINKANGKKLEKKIHIQNLTSNKNLLKEIVLENVNNKNTKYLLEYTDELQHDLTRVLLQNKIQILKDTKEICILNEHLKNIYGIPDYKYELIERSIENITNYNYYGDIAEKLMIELKNYKKNLNINNIIQKTNYLNTKLKTLQYQANQNKYINKVIKYKDVEDNTWYGSHILYSTNEDIISGYKTENQELTGYFKPFQNLTIAEAVKIVVTANKLVIPQPRDVLEEDTIVIDANDHWAKKYFLTAETLDIDLVKNPNLKPDRYITRKEIIKLVLQSFGYQNMNATYQIYDDVPLSNDYINWINLGSDYGLINGDEYNNTYRPNDNLNRAEAAKIIHKAQIKLMK